MANEVTRVLDVIKDYKIRIRTMDLVHDVFIQNDMRYLDPLMEAYVAGFIDNNAIKIQQEFVKHRVINTNNIKGPQKEMKSIAIDLLKKRGYEVVSIEKQFMGGIPDVLMQSKGKTIAIECGPCGLFKGIDYLENDKTELFILKPVERGYNLYKVSRSKNWHKMIKYHRKKELGVRSEMVQKAFDNAFKELE